MALAKVPLGQDTVSQGLLRALRGDEIALARALEAFWEARANYDVASRRFGAMRDAIRERLEVNPYSTKVTWPQVTPQEIAFDPQLETYQPGRFRYIHLKIGDAALDVLRESSEPLELGQIAQKIIDGGLHHKDARAVNAALINTKDIKKLDDARYIYEKEADPEDDLPW